MSGETEPVPLQNGSMDHPNSGQFKYSKLDTNQGMPRDYFVWSLLSLLYSNPCLGLAALIHSVKARDRKMVGDLEGARSYGSIARRLNVIATVFFCFLSLMVLIIYSLCAQ